MPNTNRLRFPRSGPARVSNREQLAQRRRKNAIRIGAATATALFAGWILLRAEPAAPFHRVADWFASTIGSANALAKSDANAARRAAPAVGAQRPPALETVPLRAVPPRDDLRARSGADLGGPELASEANGAAAERSVRVQTARVQNVAAAPPVAPAPVKPTEPTPTQPTPVTPAPDDPAAPGPGDVLGGLVPSDFDGSLGVGAAVGGISADVATNLDEGAVAVDTGVRVETPVAPIEVGTQIAMNPGGADVGATLGAGPAAVSTQVAVAPGGVGATVGAIGSDIRLDAGAGSGLGTAVSLEDAGVPISVALDLNENLAVDATAGGVTAPIGQLLDRLPIDLPIRLH